MLSGFGFESDLSTDEIIGRSRGTCNLTSDESNVLLPDLSRFSCDSSSGEGGCNILLKQGRQDLLGTYLLIIK